MSLVLPDDVIELYPESDREWARDFNIALWWKDLDDSQCAAELRKVLDAIRDSGQSAEELFGDPAEFGEVRAYARLTPQQLADSELPVSNSWGLIAGAGLVVGLLCAGFGIWIGFRDGWAATSWHYWQLAALSAGAGLAVSGHLWWLHRVRGKFALSWILGLAAATAATAVAVLIAVLGAEEAMPLPNWLVPIIGVALVVSVFWLPFTEESGAKREAVCVDVDPESWFAEVSRLLRGRYGMRSKEADFALESAREHWSALHREDGNARISEEFGTPIEFAIGLSVNTGKALKRRWLLRRLFPLAVVGLYSISLVPAVIAPERSGWDIFFAVCMLIFAAGTLYELRPANRASYVEDRLAERRAQSRGLEEGKDG